MPVYRLDRRLQFPPPEGAEDGIVAVGGDLRPERLLLAYGMGIFPWYHEGRPILWHSPDPRAVLVLDEVHVSRSLRRVLSQGRYEVTFDRAFVDVIRACKLADRPGQGGTWITDEQEAAFVRLHELGIAHSAESWAEGELAGGLYGLSIGRMFFGESMFSHRTDASKVALVTLARRLQAAGAPFLDAQVRNAFTESMGAREWPRSVFLERLASEVTMPAPPAMRQGSWDERRRDARR